jgi:hypothetical protein
VVRSGPLLADQELLTVENVARLIALARATFAEPPRLGFSSELT